LKHHKVSEVSPKIEDNTAKNTLVTHSLTNNDCHFALMTIFLLHLRCATCIHHKPFFILFHA